MMAFPIVNNIGVEKVLHDHLRFNTKQIEKGARIVSHIVNVIENKINEQETEIVGHCVRRSMFPSTVRSSFRIDGERRVVKDSFICECEFGAVGDCPHVAALLISLNI